MGTVFNAKKWKGACVKGKKVCGLVKNGVLFFKSDNYTPPISKKYKRRIVIEDNLSGKIISSTFVEGFKSVIVNEIPAVQFSEVDFLVSNEKGLITGQYIEDSYMGTVDYIISSSIAKNNSGGNSAYIYSLNTDEESIFNYNNFPISDEKEIIVTEIVNSATYRNFYIEDENIRPLEVGDVITENTKFYFTFPDNFNSSINFEDRKYIVVMDNTYTGFIVNKDYLGSSVVAATISFGFGSTQVEIYEYDNDNGTLLQNDSYCTNIKNGDDNFVGTVTNIDTTDNIYQYILVDTTTLGA